MPRLIFDIETIGENFDDLDATTQKTLTRWIKREFGDDEEKYAAAVGEIKDGLGFSPLTGEIVALGVLDADTQKGAVYFQSPGEKIAEFEEEGIKYKSLSEKEILDNFWRLATKYDEFVSFNGRTFDAPFLAVRSAVNEIRPTKDLMSNRYLTSQKFNAKHVDLLDQLSFYGAMQRKGSLHLWCRAFGVKSPKEEASGDEVGKMFKDKKYLDIARYNANDLKSTCALYGKWEKYFKF